jgi:TRAP-type C4-dicarboxylate transport system permease small subunit
MVIKIIALALGIAALLLTFRVDWVLKTFFKSEEPTLEAKLKVKYIALAVAVAAFVITFIESNL